MLFRRRKTQELDKQAIEDVLTEGGEDLSWDESEEEEYEDDGLHEEELPADGPYEDAEEMPSSFDTVFDEGALNDVLDEEFDFGEEENAESSHEKLSPVETGAWDYIYGEPNEDYLTDTGNFHFDLDGPAGGVFLPEEEPDGEQPPRKVHVRKKHKKHHYLLKFFLFCLTVALVYAFMMSSYFNVNKISVEGTVNYSAEQIIELSGLKKGKNTFKIKAGDAEKKIEEDPHISKATIKRDLPKSLVITIEERLPAAQIKYGEDEYVVIDGNGYILSVGEKVDGAAVLKGLTVKGEHVTAGTDVKVKEGAALDEALSLMKSAGAEGFSFKTMDMSEKQVRLYLTKNLLIKGDPAVIKEHIENGDITLILKDLEEKDITKGTIKATTDDSFTFSPDKE